MNAISVQNMGTNCDVGNRRRRRARMSFWSKRTVEGLAFICFSCLFILLSFVQTSESSVVPTSSIKATALKTQQDAEKSPKLEVVSSANLPQPPLNPFISERTIVSGFGSKNYRKTIFAHRSTKLKKKKSTIEANEKEEENEDEVFPTIKSPKMWVQKPKYVYDEKEADVLWMLVRDEDESSTSEKDCHIVLKLTFDDETDDWVAKRATQSEESSFVNDHPLDEWIPIQGLYGAYKVPSGVLWILVAGAEAVYEAPPIESASTPSWWQIRRVTNLEIVHLGEKGYQIHETTSAKSKMTIVQTKATLLAASRLREEVRQISLLRKALKQHDFYYVPKGDVGNGRVVRDMTKSLQRSILDVSTNKNEKNDSWWKSSDEDEDETDLLPDARFFWNQHAVEPLVRKYKDVGANGKENDESAQIANLLLQTVVPLTSAFVGIQKNLTVSGETSSEEDLSYDQLLISRRSRFRAGTRFTVRGADAAGDCANFAETEQICLTTKGKDRSLRSVASHVQTRGSIPLRWSSPADVKTYRPRVNIGADPLAQARAMKLHILSQLRHYALRDDETATTKSDESPGVADIVFVNLVDKHSDQGRLGRAFDAVLKAVVDVHAVDSSSKPKTKRKRGFPTPKSEVEIGPNSVEHVWYDFHAEVKNGRWDRLSLLLDQIQPSLTSHGYFMAHPPSGDDKGDDEWKIDRLQRAVVRTNCMDCLDRTNVVQSIFGRYMLFQQLSNEVGDDENQSFWASLTKSFKESAMTIPWGTGEVAHRLLWADNADAISRLYAGTPALKGDFTRTGKRTKKGALDDGMNSLQRYYLNNFLDADRQEGYDLLVGHATFSNVVEEDPTIEEEEEPTKESPSNPFLSFLGKTRGNILSDVVKGSSDREDLQKRLEEIGVSKQFDLDLRWLPGDLQTQVRGQANEGTSEGSDDDEETNVTPIFALGPFSSQQAMKAIDERSHIEMPWWTKSGEGWLEVDEDEDDEVAISSQHQGQVIVTPLQLAVVFYMGLKAPTLLGSIALGILSFVYLPECIQHDYQQQKDIRDFVENRLDNKELEEE